MVWAWRITCTGSQHWNQQQQKKTTKKKLFFLPKKFSKNIYKYYIGKIILYYTVWIWITTYIFNLIYINKFSFERLYFANLIITVIYIYIQTVLKTEQTTNEKKKQFWFRLFGSNNILHNRGGGGGGGGGGTNKNKKILLYI